jgi:WD40 repeat protein
VWDLDTELTDNALAGHNGEVNAVAAAMLNDRPIAITGSDDRTVRLWDLTTMTQQGHPIWMPFPVAALAVGPGHELIIASGWEVIVLAPQLR